MNEWQDTKEQPPPDDHTAIDLRFGNDPMPLRTTGKLYHRNVTAFGPPPIRVFWRLVPLLN